MTIAACDGPCYPEGIGPATFLKLLTWDEADLDFGDLQAPFGHQRAGFLRVSVGLALVENGGIGAKSAKNPSIRKAKAALAFFLGNGPSAIVAEGIVPEMVLMVLVAPIIGNVSPIDGLVANRAADSKEVLVTLVVITLSILGIITLSQGPVTGSADKMVRMVALPKGLNVATLDFLPTFGTTYPSPGRKGPEQ
jgi:hypothetical protein